MQTDTHIEVISPYHCYDCFRHTGMNFYNYESPCQMMVNPMPVTFNSTLTKSSLAAPDVVTSYCWR